MYIVLIASSLKNYSYMHQRYAHYRLYYTFTSDSTDFMCSHLLELIVSLSFYMMTATTCLALLLSTFLCQYKLAKDNIQNLANLHTTVLDGAIKLQIKTIGNPAFILLYKTIKLNLALAAARGCQIHKRRDPPVSSLHQSKYRK